MRSPGFWIRRWLGKYVVHLLISERRLDYEDTVAIYYRDSTFLHFIRESIQLLKAHDSLHYLSVQKRVRAIVEGVSESPSFLGHVVGVYIDDFTAEQRLGMGAKRYAGCLVRFATDLRLLNDWGIEDAIHFRSRTYSRLAPIAVRRELACCEALGCEMKEIYHIQRWLRADTESRDGKAGSDQGRQAEDR